MLSRTCGRAARSILVCVRELLFILAVGVLGSQLLITLNDGKPLGSEALAVSYLPGGKPVVVSSIDLDVDPGNPAVLRSIYLQVVFPGNAESRGIAVSPTPTSPESYPCHIESNATWHCPTPGLKIAELEQVVISGS
jgi:hypothetical protein